MKQVIHLNPPAQCDVCKANITEEFVDGMTVYGPWANMCMSCFNIIGIGLGTGRGQLYRKHDDKFIKEEG